MPLVQLGGVDVTLHGRSTEVETRLMFELARIRISKRPLDFIALLYNYHDSCLGCLQYHALAAKLSALFGKLFANQRQSLRQSSTPWNMDNYSQRQMIGIGISFLILPTVAVGVRLWAKRLGRKGISVDDYLIVISLARKSIKTTS